MPLTAPPAKSTRSSSRNPPAKAPIKVPTQAPKKVQKAHSKPCKQAAIAKQPPKKAVTFAEAPPARLSPSSSPPVEIVSSPPYIEQLPASSPAQVSSPAEPEDPLYTINIQYSLRVNGVRKPGDMEYVERCIFFLSIIEDKMLALIDNPASTIDGREYTWQSRVVQFKSDGKKATTQQLLLKDFGLAEETRLLKMMDNQVRSCKGSTTMKLQVEISLLVEVLKKAFIRNTSVNELSSPPPKDDSPTIGGKRTQKLLYEARANERIIAIQSKLDHQSAIHKMWQCSVAGCDNFGKWCYIHPNGSHYKIEPIDAEQWSQSIVDGKSSAMVPHLDIIEALKLRGNQLKFNPHSRWGKKKKRNSLSSSDDGPSLKKLQKQVEKQRIMNQMARMEEDEATRAERRELREFQLQQMRAAVAPVATHLNMGYHYPHRAETPVPKTIPVLSSSPVTGGGKEDTREIVRKFFTWLVEQQPEDERTDYEQAHKVAIEQRWTIKDLREMANVKGDLYPIAMGFGLKDGVVRHLAEDLRCFKQVFRTASTLGLEQ